MTAGNSRVKEARKLSRRSVRAGRRLFLADGPKAVQSALAVPDCVVEVFATPAATEQYAALAVAAHRWTLVDDRALASLSDSVTPAGLVAICHFLDAPLSAVVERSSPVVEQGGAPGADRVETPAPTQRGDHRLLVIAADVRDPGNAGTLIRTADAVGANGVVLAGHSVDPYNPKAVRASVGSLFQLPVVVEPDPAAAVAASHASGLTVLAADGAGDVDLFEAEHLLRGPTAWLFGNEAWGLPDHTAALADHRVRIPILGRAESLNLATAAAVCLYASARARRR